MRTAVLRCGRGPASLAPGRSSWRRHDPGRRRRGPPGRPAGRWRPPSRPDRRPGRSTLPHPPANSVSPLYSRPSSSASRQTEPSVWPGVCRTRKAEVAEADDAAFGQVHGRHRRHDLERRPQRLRVGQPLAIEGVDGDVGAGVLRDRRVVADVVPVAVRGHDELEGPVAGGELVGDPGERRRRRVDGDGLARPRVGQDVDVRGDRSDDAMQALHRAIVAAVDGRVSRPSRGSRRARAPTRAAGSPRGPSRPAGSTNRAWPEMSRYWPSGDQATNWPTPGVTRRWFAAVDVHDPDVVVLARLVAAPAVLVGGGAQAVVALGGERDRGAVGRPTGQLSAPGLSVSLVVSPVASSATKMS